MGKVVSQGKCPYCPAWFAYTEYADGGFHCFSCGKHGEGNAYKKLIAGKVEATSVAHDHSSVALPEDAGRKLPDKALNWLRKYDITDAEMDQHGMLYSPSKELLIFPVWGSSQELLMWQGRYFGEAPRHPRYITKGKPSDVLHILKAGTCPYVVLTEDLISAIKVSRVATAMPLWGSQLSTETAKRIGEWYEDAFLFLDFDKRDTAIKLAIKHSHILHIRPIIATLDPKCYSSHELQKLIDESNIQER